MASRRPFGSVPALLAAADEVWWSLDAEDWHEAFRAHPRIGETKAQARQTARASAWSAQEQSGAARADDGVTAALAEGNRAYEARFGHIYIVCATGKTAPEMLDILRARLAHDAETELRVAAGEQAKITRLRLEKLLASQASPDV
jgi:OHCU decarboxylase